MIYKGNVGIVELMDFYKKADKSLVTKVDELFATGEPKAAWRIVLQFLNKPINEEDMNEFNWKAAAAAGLLGLSTLATGAAQKHNAVTTHKPAMTHAVKSTVDIFKDSIDTILKHYENSTNNPVGGFDKSVGKWFPHKSIEGGTDTIAYGHKIVSGENFSNGLTDSEATQLLKKDISAKESFAKRKIENYDKLPQYVKNGIINALYRGDLGPKTLKLMNMGQWDGVAKEYLNHPNYTSGKYPKIKERMKMNADAFEKYAAELRGK